MLYLLYHLNLLRRGQLLSPFREEETDLRGQIMCLRDTGRVIGCRGAIVCDSGWDMKPGSLSLKDVLELGGSCRYLDRLQQQ